MSETTKLELLWWGNEEHLTVEVGLSCRDSGVLQTQEVWIPISSLKPTYWPIIPHARGGTVWGLKPRLQSHLSVSQGTLHFPALLP